MNDNRFAMMRVNRSGTTSRSGHGDEAVPTRSEGTGTTPAQGYADAGARRGASRSGACAGSQSANDLKLGEEVGQGSPSMAAQTVGTPQWLGRRAEETVGQSLAGRRGGQRLSDR